jgi:hypothetical protein
MNRYSQKMSIFVDGFFPVIEKPRRPEAHEVQVVERFIGVELPKNYLEFVSAYGGFAPCASARFPLDPSSGDREGILAHFMGIGHPRLTSNLLENCKTYRGRIPANLLPIAHDPGGNVICLSLSGNDKGNVYFWDKDYEREPPDYSNLYLIAKTFDDFIDFLHPKT